MWAQTLPRASRSNSENNSITKYIVTCQDRISSKTPSTNEWLTITNSLKPAKQTDLHRVLKGILEKRKRVAIKISSSPYLNKEYTTAITLKDIPGFIRPICFFECEDSYSEFPSSERTSLCKGPGSSLKVLVLPFFEEGSIRNYNWSTKPPEALQSCMLQCLCSLLQAYEKHGFIHSDTHMDNVLIKKTTKTNVEYVLNGNKITVKTYGYLIAFMDFECSFIEVSTNRGRSIGQVYHDILHTIHDLRYNNKFSIVGDKELSDTLYYLIDNPVDPYTAIKHLHPLYKNIQAIPKISGSVKPVYNPIVS